MRALVLLTALAACGTTSAYRNTRVSTPGHTQWLFGAQVSGARAAGIDESGRETDGAAPLPELALSVRRGLDERFEAQANATMLPTKFGQTGSLELAGKYRVGQRGRYSLAVGGAAGYRLSHVSGAVVEDVYGSIPVIGGIDFGRHQLVLSAVGGYHRLYASGAQPVDLPFLGSSIGFLWQLSKRFALLPEAGSAWTPAKNFMSDDSRLFHVGLALLWTR